jgi:hypothetical protein
MHPNRDQRFIVGGCFPVAGRGDGYEKEAQRARLTVWELNVG